MAVAAALRRPLPALGSCSLPPSAHTPVYRTGSVINGRPGAPGHALATRCAGISKL